MSDNIYYKNSGTLKIGDVHRFIITYTPDNIINEIGSNLFIKVKNIENVLMNSAHLHGPYMIYCDIRNSHYSHKNPCFITDDQPFYEPNIIPGNSLIHKLTLNKLNDKYIWIVDIISQIVFSTNAEIKFEILLSNNESSLNKNYSNLKNSNFKPNNLSIQHLTTLDIWNKPPKSIDEPIHLVLLNHGLHSNSSADMFYLKEQIESMASITGENIVIRAYFDNVCKTERGIKYLGRRLAEFIINDSLNGLNNNVNKISFIGHSLGGPVQTFAISYINYNYPEFFKQIHPENFITLASPLLGISNENPAYVKAFLKFGIVGKTGQDLNLDGNQPLLLLLPSEPTRKILKKFKRRTVYANVLNDGIVPLRTSALLYLDWKALTKIYETLDIHGDNPPETKQEANEDHQNYDNKYPNNNNKQNSNSSTENSETREIPDDLENESLRNNNNNNNNNGNNNKTDLNIVDNLKRKIFATVGYCLPNLQAPKTTHKYNYFQTVDDSIDEEDEQNNDTENNNNYDNQSKMSVDKIKQTMTSIPKSSVITSLKKILLPPSPSTKYINDPKSRYNVILHDKIYTPDMIPSNHTNLSKNIIISQLEQNKRHRFFEEKIARRWHEGMSWRKVLVYLQPDAHNNMIVRRRFANAYGWQVIDHLVEEHFSLKSFKGDDINLWKLKDKNDEFIDLEEDEVDNLNEEFQKVMHKEFTKESSNHSKKSNNLNKLYEKNSEKEDEEEGEEKEDNNNNNNNNDNDDDTSERESDDGKWLNETNSVYYDGPTGMINTVTEEMQAWKQSILNMNAPALNDESNTNQAEEIEEMEALRFI